MGGINGGLMEKGLTTFKVKPFVPGWWKAAGL
jgi:hypothetical protein